VKQAIESTLESDNFLDVGILFGDVEKDQQGFVPENFAGIIEHG
jgi:hypothetical protein